MSHTYEELWKPIGENATYPETCPICTAGIREDNRDNYKGPVYECGGQYTSKPQIQNHTDKWWGSCPAEYLKELEATNLLDATARVWAVKENGIRWHVASFSGSSLAESYARSFSKDYPLFWNDESPVSYIEVEGNLTGESGHRYRRGELIAKKSYPHHIEGANKRERQWFKIEQLDVGKYRYGELI